MVTIAMLEDRLNLADRVVVVAGAGGGGIGTAVCRMLVEAGARVAAIDVDRDKLAISEAAIDELGGHALGILADVRDPEAVDDAVRQAAELGSIHGLVHVAGGFFPDQWASIRGMPPETFAAAVELNLNAAFLTTKSVASALVSAGQGGSIVHISSIAALSGLPFGAPYAAAKAGMLALMRTAALELGAQQIRVNAVVGGSVRTLRNAAESPPEDSAAERAAVPLGRRGLPVDIAGAALFLLSDLASYVTGQALVVDGGSSTRPSLLDADNLPVFVHDPDLRARLLQDET